MKIKFKIAKCNSYCVDKAITAGIKHSCCGEAKHQS